MDSAVDRAARGIRALIISGSYAPGDRLPSERELARDLDVSRPALREGIRRLRSGGVLESRRGSGTYVPPIDMRGLFDVRLKLEPLAAERAALNRSEAELAALAATVDELRNTLDDPPRYDSADARLHALVAQASRSPVLISTLEMLTELGMLIRTATTTDYDMLESMMEDIERIYRTIERQHPKRAASAMERHIITVREHYDKSVSENSLKPIVAG